MSFAIIDVEGPAKVTHKNTQTGIHYDIEYQVYFTGQFEAPAMAYNTDSRLPKIGTFPFNGSGTYLVTGTDNNAYCASTSSDLAPESYPIGTTDDPGIAIYRCECEQVRIDQIYQTPMSRPPECEGGGGDVQSYFMYDKDHHAMVNSANDLFDSPPPQYIQSADLVVTVNQTANPISMAASNSYTVNSSSWNGEAAGTGLLKKISYRYQIESILGTQYTYWRVSYPLSFRYDGWRWKPLDNGFNIKDPSTGLKVKYVDSTGQESTHPILLDGSGHPATGTAATNGVVFPTAGYKIFNESAWPSGIPNVFAL